MRLAAALLWLSAGGLVTLLGLRFGLRLLGVRYDTPFPGWVYSATEPLVQPLYRWLPAPERFDYYAVELASPAAAALVLAVALAIYVLGLLAVSALSRTRRPSRSRS